MMITFKTFLFFRGPGDVTIGVDYWLRQLFDTFLPISHRIVNFDSFCHDSILCHLVVTSPELVLLAALSSHDHRTSTIIL